MKKIWNTISLIGLREAEASDIILHYRGTVLLNRMIAVLTLIMLFYVPVEIIINGFELLGVVLFDVLAISMVLVFNHYKKYETAKYYFALVGILLIGPIGLLVPHGAGNELFLIPTSTIGILLLNNKRIGLFYALLCLFALIAVFYLRGKIEPLFPMPDDLLRKVYPFFVIMTLLIVFLVVYYFRNINEEFQQRVEEQKEELSRSNELISEKNKEITDSINYAKRIQDAYLPPMPVFERLFDQGFIFFRPKDIVSGDFYWFYMQGAVVDGAFSGKHSDTVFFAVADCTGHGVPGALMNVVCCNALNEVVVTRGLSDPAKILDETRLIVARNMKSGMQNGQKDGMDISLCRLNKNTGELVFAGAHNSGWIFRSDQSLPEELKADKQPVGHFEPAKPFSEKSIFLRKNDMIYLFSDGYSDQFGGPKGKKFKQANLLKLFSGIHHLPTGEQKRVIEKQFEFWKGELEQIDDVCVLGIRF